MQRNDGPPHRHRNRDGDWFTHAHEHHDDHCGGDCDRHERKAARERRVGARA